MCGSGKHNKGERRSNPNEPRLEDKDGLRARPKRNRMIAKVCTFPLRCVEGLQGRSAAAYRESAWLGGLPTLKLLNQRCHAQRFEIADFLFGRACPASSPSTFAKARGLAWCPGPRHWRARNRTAWLRRSCGRSSATTSVSPRSQTPRACCASCPAGSLTTTSFTPIARRAIARRVSSTPGALSGR